MGIRESMAEMVGRKAKTNPDCYLVMTLELPSFVKFLLMLGFERKRKKKEEDEGRK